MTDTTGDMPESEKLTALEQVKRLHRDLKKASVTLTATEARFLVDSYYIMQDDRKRAHNQERALDKSEEPHEIISWLADNSRMLENTLKAVLDVYSDSKLIGRWMKSLTGIGPVISAGMMAHIDITKCSSAGDIWSFAGLHPLVKWEKGKKRPWNAQLKTLCWKTGQSFMKFSNHPDCMYGAMYRTRKHDYEIPRNESFGNAVRAKQILEEKNFRKDTEAYQHLSKGKLPPAQIDAMARRYVVKLFLSHLFIAWYFYEYNKLPPSPYAIAVLGHAHFIPPPNAGLIPGLEDALRAAGPAG